MIFKKIFLKFASFFQKIFSRKKSQTKKIESNLRNSHQSFLFFPVKSKSIPKKRIKVFADDIISRVNINFRLKAHQELRKLIEKKASDETVAEFTLGNLYEPANFTAQKERDEGKNLAQMIQENNDDWVKQVAQLTKCLYQYPQMPHHQFSQLLDHFDINHLKISVASEIAMILHPTSFMAINKRTLFAYFKLQEPLRKFDAQVGDDHELIAFIIKNYYQWVKLIVPTTQLFQNIFFQRKQQFSWDERYQYFYVENFCTQYFEIIKNHQEPHGQSLLAWRFPVGVKNTP
jgi:hypothetical protein